MKSSDYNIVSVILNQYLFCVLCPFSMFPLLQHTCRCSCSRQPESFSPSTAGRCCLQPSWCTWSSRWSAREDPMGGTAATPLHHSEVTTTFNTFLWSWCRIIHLKIVQKKKRDSSAPEMAEGQQGFFLFIFNSSVNILSRFQRELFTVITLVIDLMSLTNTDYKLVSKWA